MVGDSLARECWELLFTLLVVSKLRIRRRQRWQDGLIATELALKGRYRYELNRIQRDWIVRGRLTA